MVNKTQEGVTEAPRRRVIAFSGESRMRFEVDTILNGCEVHCINGKYKLLVSTDFALALAQDIKKLFSIMDIWEEEAI